jgi:very-short-patch-repair endonuclease
VTVPSTVGGRRKRPHLRIHRSHLPKNATTRHERIAVTTPARTLADLKPAVEPHLHRRATRQAEYLGLPLANTPTDRTRSELERAFLRLCRRHHLPPPDVNVPIGRFTVDFLWPEHRLAVETDGWAAHRGRQAFEDDRYRELELHRLGYRLHRFSHSQITDRPEAVAAALRTAIVERFHPVS